MGCTPSSRAAWVWLRPACSNARAMRSRLALLERLVVVERRRRRRAAREQPGRQIVGHHAIAAAEHQRLLDDVLELAHVARPVVAEEAGDDVGGERARLPAAARRVLAHEVVGEQRQILLAVAQRRQGQRDDVEPVEQILAEGAGLDRRVEVAIGRGDQPEVDAHRPRAADPLELALLQRAQQLRLQVERQLADLVEKQRAAVGELEPSLLQAERAGERALLVAEELGLEQRLGQRRAVDRHERPGGARAVAVHGARDELLAGAALAADQHGRVALRDARDAIEDGAHRLAAADHVVFEVDLRLQPLLAFLQPRRLPRLLARHRRERRDHQQQTQVPLVERRRLLSGGLDPGRAGRTPEGDHRTGEHPPAAGVDNRRPSAVRTRASRSRRRPRAPCCRPTTSRSAPSTRCRRNR